MPSLAPAVKRICYLLSFVLLIALLWGPSRSLVMALQSGEEWTKPVNISQSGTATQPYMVMDANQQLHVLWQDMLDDFFVYTHGSGNEWSSPIPVEVPFGTRAFFPDLVASESTPLFAPHLIAEGTGIIHAFWMDSEEKALFHSQVAADTFADLATWSQRQRLAEGVVQVESYVGSNGRLHLSYMTSAADIQTPAGLYYRFSDDSGANWSEPVLLYQSAYFRLLETADTQLHMSAEGEDLYIAWDNRPRERVYLVHSSDNGTTWDAPEEIDSRQETDGNNASGPTRINLAVQNDIVHLTWQAGHEGFDCAQYHQWSDDGGANWQGTERLLPTFSACPQDAEFIMGGSELFLLVKIETSTYLLAWDGQDWSEPFLQPSLTTFVDENVFRPVTYNCGQELLVSGAQLLAISCGVNFGQDVWLSTLSLPAFAESIRVTPIWSTPAPLAGETNLIAAPVLLADRENNLHLFWSQPDTAVAMPQRSIYYAHEDGSNWTRPTAILTSPQGEANEPAVALGSANNLLVVWASGGTGNIYFSRVSVDQALTSSAWADPLPLPVPRTAVGSPDIIVGGDGVIRVIYAIALNEQRGLYLVTSEDGGASWSEPMTVFDGAAAGWEMVAQPHLAQSDGNDLHLLWLRQPLPGSDNVSSLYYSHSEDGGETWAEAAQVQDNLQQSTRIVWSQIVTVGDRVVHRAWQEVNDGRIGLWHQYSLDSGLTWSLPGRVAEGEGDSGAASLTVDGVGQLHLLQVAPDIVTDGQTAVLQHWVWQDDRWQSAEDNLTLAAKPALRADTLAAAIATDGRLNAVYVSQSGESETIEDLIFVDRRLPLTDITPTPLPTLTPTPQPTATIEPTVTPEPTPALVFPTERSNNGLTLPIIGSLGSQNAIIVSALLALIPIALIASIVIFFRLRSRNN